jgi:hypothetical protein
MNRNNKIVLLTGAGFSSIVGLKTLKSIVEAIQVPIDTSNEIVSIVTETWKVLKGQKGDNTTLEDLIAKLKLNIEVAQLITDDFVFREHLQPNIAQINSGQFKLKWEQSLSYCFRLILDNYGPQKIKITSNGFRFINEALGLLSKKNNNSLHVFTTNYDCLMNVLADNNLNLNFYSHIDNENGKFEKEWSVINKKHYDKTKNSIYIHRLHGCIGWFSDKVSPYGVHEVFGTGSKLEINDFNKLNQMAIKLTSDEKIGLKPAFSCAFDEFDVLLKKCEILLVWGHSFKDLQVLKSIITSTKNNERNPLRIYFIDPYMANEDIINNIQDTIRGETGVKNNIKSLTRIDWEICDGYQKLYEQIDKIL